MSLTDNRAIKQGDPRAEERRIFWSAVDTLALQTYLQASDMSVTFVQKISINGAVPGAAGAAAPHEISVAECKGFFYSELALSDISITGTHMLIVRNTGGAHDMEPRFIDFRVEPAFMGKVASGTLSATSFSTTLLQTAADHWKDGWVRFITGALAGQVKRIGAYNPTGGLITLANGYAFTGSPAVDDVIEIENR